jgi:ribosomal protein S27E
LQMLARAEKIINAKRPPAKISEKSDFFKCTMCRHQAVCHFEAMPRATCRSCIHATPEMGGDARWSCARWDKPLSFDEQKAACPTHLFDPDFVPGEQIDVDEEAETITYRMKDGSIWIDGGNDVANG